VGPRAFKKSRVKAALRAFVIAKILRFRLEFKEKFFTLGKKTASAANSGFCAFIWIRTLAPPDKT